MNTIFYIDEEKEIENVISWLSKQDSVGVDTETTGLDPLTSKVLLIQVGTPMRQYVLDVAQLGNKKITQFLIELNEPKLVKILHNSIFDYMMLKTNFGISLNNMKCTMLGEILLVQGTKISVSLEAVVKKYLGITLEKSTRDSFQKHTWGEKFSEKQIRYSAQDVEYLIPVHRSIQKLLNKRDMGILSELEYETAPVLGDMSLNGIYLNADLWIPLEEKAMAGVETARIKLNDHFKGFIEAQTSGDLFGSTYVINYNSPKQLLPRLREITKIQLTSTNADYLEYYKDRHEVIADVINYRQEQKKISTYGTVFLKNISSIDNRIHSKFRQLKAQTGRLSSDDPNMMNLPSHQSYRTPFCVQDPDWNFISADFSGQELRLLAHAAQEPEMIKALNKGIDLHTYSASLLFNKSYDDINIEERNQCKAITFALLYGAGPTKLSRQLKIPFEDARTLMNRYFAVFPHVKDFMSKMVAHVEEKHFAYSPLDGRRINLAGLDWDNKALVAHAINQAKNLPFQGTGASTIKLALVRLNNRINKNKYNAKIVNAIHDEILVEVCAEHTQEVKIAMEEEMVKAFNYFADSVPMEVTAVVGKYWIH